MSIFRIGLLLASLSLLAAAAGCGDDDNGDATANPTRVASVSASDLDLGEDEFIDSLPEGGGIDTTFRWNLKELITVVPQIAVLEVTAIAETVVPTAPPGGATPFDRNRQPLPWTTYSVSVREWIKGDGPTETTVTSIGGLDHDGPRFYDQTFLLQVGRVYLMPLKPREADTPGIGEFEGITSGATTFEVTDGTTHILNHEAVEALVGELQGLSLDKLETQVREWIESPPTLAPTPTPAAS